MDRELWSPDRSWPPGKFVVRVGCLPQDVVRHAGRIVFIDDVDNYPPENGFGAPTENAWGGDIWGVAAVLESKYGWSEDEVRGFLGENLLRVFDATWKP